MSRKYPVLNFESGFPCCVRLVLVILPPCSWSSTLFPVATMPLCFQRSLGHKSFGNKKPELFLKKWLQMNSPAIKMLPSAWSVCSQVWWWWPSSCLHCSVTVLWDHGPWIIYASETFQRRVNNLRFHLAFIEHNCLCMSVMDPLHSLQSHCVEALTPSMAVFGEREWSRWSHRVRL